MPIFEEENNAKPLGILFTEPNGKIDFTELSPETLESRKEYARKKVKEIQGMADNMLASIHVAEKQITDKRINRVNNICYALLVLLYCIGAYLILKTV